ncbi:Peptide/nickel transport system permease protein [Bosea sp. 62]|uniref:ABC transporter permease n=1 Tax=unclassified Bosea (in: a-proteobacteria) TaxID=2653178 RepID=UPI001257E933|nr:MULTISPECIES: ABC transporter permease [unclassified Bosea (in: a-proteobacteria)]CAD5251088.1 Peptide/nickel transport system permease protein [Bosea sp. 7B]CAD5281122.1 Peptide/nickel transport system permease protein [Bosea sp. 21B]CAD5282272.1 Peptide/nickel transport system permease protein [Bosea sp. 46]VVT59352.1 Peptide/nickel transport system permease protein [Bosea sp. EC-HK365B]VXB25627.1 Peptide/nickel transport system permease protein [Bosea sp. 62]
MLRFLILRFLRALLTVAICVSAVFLALRLAGDPADIMLSIETPPDVRAHYRELWGLDRPLAEQYLRYLASVARGDFGLSFADDRPAFAAVVDALPKTFLLGACALLLALLIGMPLGVLAALRHNTAVDRFAMAVAVLGYAIPIFFLGILLILLFALKLRVLPSAGSETLWHLILPVVTLALPLAGRLARFARTATLEVLGKPFIRAARARGVMPLSVILRHALPNAAVPLLMFIGIEIGHILAGSAVVETIFAWPGIGRLLVDSVSSRDLAVVQAVILTVTVVMVTANLLVDILHILLDPRLGGFSRSLGKPA